VKLNNVVIEDYDYDSNGSRSDYSSTRACLAGTSTYNDDDQLEANSFTLGRNARWFFVYSYHTYAAEFACAKHAAGYFSYGHIRRRQ
jgi:hypothetical protein